MRQQAIEKVLKIIINELTENYVMENGDEYLEALIAKANIVLDRDDGSDRSASVIRELVNERV